MTTKSTAGITKIPFTDFPSQSKIYKDPILESIGQVLDRGNYILGEQVALFEKSFAKLSNVKYAIGVANGTDALVLALKAIGVGRGDEVITVPNSWISSASCIALLDAKPVFVDVRNDFNMNPALIERAITSRTKAILPVHLTGKCADMETIVRIANKHSISVIEDAAQAAGAKHKGKLAGTFGKIGCFSLHPLKNLNAIGDAGILTTNDDQLAQILRLLRNHGLETRDEVSIWGHNSRLDTIQAAVLNVKIKDLEMIINKRRENAKLYTDRLRSIVECPKEDPEDYSIYSLYIIQCDYRDELKSFLAEKGIVTKIHYPKPIHLQACSIKLGYKKGSFPEAERQSERILSLPIYQSLTSEQIEYVCDSIFDFYKKINFKGVSNAE